MTVDDHGDRGSAPKNSPSSDHRYLSQNSLADICSAFHKGQRFLVTAHPNPDGDAIGSIMATYACLLQMGRIAVPFISGHISLRYRFLENMDAMVTELPQDPWDTTVILDCTDGRMFSHLHLSEKRLGTIVLIDHHLTTTPFGHVVFRDPEAASVGVILYRLFREMQIVITKPIAEALFCSVMSDTGSFRYQNANVEAMSIAADLVAMGVDPWRVASHLYEDRSRSEVELLVAVLQTLVLSTDGKAAALVVTENMLKKTGCTMDAVDGLINYARGLRGVEVAVLLRPHDRGIRVSLRSRGNIDVSKIAEKFGGGGHFNAAGFLARGSVSKWRTHLFQAVSEQIIAKSG